MHGNTKIKNISGKSYSIYWFSIINCYYPSLKREGPENYEIWVSHNSADGDFSLLERDAVYCYTVAQVPAKLVAFTLKCADYL